MQTNDSSLPGSGAKIWLVANYIREKPPRVVPPIEAALVDDCNAFDSDVDEAPTTQTMFMANLSFADPVYDEASPSYDSDIISEVQDHDNYQDADCEHHEVHEMHDDVQPNYVVDSHTDYVNDSNMILYIQYVKDNTVSVVQSNVSSMPNDAYIMIINEMHEPSALSVFTNRQHKGVNASLTAELATYTDQVELYERRANFELTEREQKIKEQLRIVITDRNIKEEKLKKELHSVKIQLYSTINLNKSMQVQPALYNGHEIIKTNHVSAIVHNLEDILEIAEITRKKINDKMKDPECVKKKVKIIPHDYSKENYLAIFTPQKQLTPEQISWSKDLLKMKVKALKEQTTASRPIKVLMVYPPNTPATLVPRVLPTKKLEAEVDQNVVNKKHDEIKWKNLLIANDNLIDDFLSKDVFYTANDFALTVSRFSDMHEAFNAAQKRIADLESEKSHLKNKIQNDDHDVMIKHFFKLEVEHLSLQLKYQHLKESFENKKSVTSLDAPTFDSVFKIRQIKDQVQSRGNMIRELREKISRMTKKHSDADPIHDLKALDSPNKELHAKVNALHDLNERWRAENEKVKRHYKELYNLIKITSAKTIDKTNSLLTEVANLKAQITKNHKSNFVIMPAVKSKVLALGMYVIDVEPIPPLNKNNKEVHLDYLRHRKESVAPIREIVE
nr:hypothetical protein [Tanacetum cinerariifolium]